MNITDEKQIKKFLTVLNKINQEMKNVKSNNEYIIVKGVCIAYPSPNTIDLGVTKLTISKPGGKKDNIDDYINLITASIDGIELANFIKENKKSVVEIVLNPTSIVFKMDNDTFYSTKQLTKDNFNFEKYKEFISNVKKSEMKLLSQLDITDEIKERMSKSSFPFLDIDGYIVRVTPKQFLKLTAKFENKAYVYSYDGLKKLVQLTTNSKDFECVQSYIVIIED